jgi:predicted ester cyclase
MSAQENVQVVRQVIEEAFNQGRFDNLPRLFKPGYREHQFGLHDTVEGMQQDIQFLRRAFPDFHLTIEQMTCDGDKVWVLSTARGTNLGGLMGPPNGKSFEISVFDLLRVEDGLIVEHWGSPDRFAQMAQLGLLPNGKA